MTNEADTHKPPMKSSDEADEKELEMARDQGAAFKNALDHMVGEVATDGGETRAGDYLVGYAVEEAEGMYHLENGELVWREPDEENLHVEVSVRDGADGRMIPGLEVHATLVGPDGDEVGTHRQPFVWHPWMHHYGRNWVVPEEGSYTLKVRIAPPDFPRHDKRNGKRYAEEVTVEFEDVTVETGQG